MSAGESGEALAGTAVELARRGHDQNARLLEAVFRHLQDTGAPPEAVVLVTRAMELCEAG